LSDAQLAALKGCAILKVNFNIRIRYASHFRSAWATSCGSRSTRSIVSKPHRFWR
jgi:hypothetical protein